MKTTVVARACALLFLGLACTPAIAKKQPEPAPEVLAATHGYLFVDAPKGVYSALNVQRIDGVGEPVALSPRGDEHQRTLGAWLPAGEYRISSYDDVKFGNDMRFEVKAGRVTDLGALVPISVGGYDVVVLPVRHADYQHDVDAVVQQFAGVLADPTPLAWAPARTPAPGSRAFQSLPGGGLLVNVIAQEGYRKNTPNDLPQLRGVATIPEFLRRAKQLAVPMTLADGIQDGAGRVYFPAELGVIRVRAQDGTWSALDTGVLARITAVGLDGDTLLAGTSDGRILRSNDRGTTWMAGTTLSGGEIAFDISHAGGEWLFATQRFNPKFAADIDTIHVYAAPNDLSASTLIQTFKLKPTSAWSLQNVVPRARATNLAYFVTSGDGVQRYDLAMKQWRALPMPKNKISTFHFDDTNSTMVAFGTGSLAAKVFLSRDAGETWKGVPRPSLGNKDVQFNADGKGYAFGYAMGAKAEQWQVEEYDVAVGGDWARTSFLPALCRPMRVGASAPPLCVTSGSDIYALRDGKWTLEFDAQ